MNRNSHENLEHTNRSDPRPAGLSSLGRSATQFLTLTVALVLPFVLNVCQAESTTSSDSSVGPSLNKVLSRTDTGFMPLYGNITPVLSETPTSEPVIRIEEDWELNITQPDTAVAAPQVGTVISPFQNLEGFYIIFLLNHRFNPQLALGGMEIQFWYGDHQLGSGREERKVLDQSNDKITWTQRMKLKVDGDSRRLCFRIMDGNSESWGAFGGSDLLHLEKYTTLTDLSNYRSQFSVKNSGVTFSSNRVASLVLKAVRGYSSSGALLFEETEPVIVYGGQSN